MAGYEIKFVFYIFLLHVSHLKVIVWNKIEIRIANYFYG